MSDKQPEALRCAQWLDHYGSVQIAHDAAAELRRQHAELIAKDEAIAELVEALRELRGAINFKAACITSNSAVEKVAFANDCVWKAVDSASAAIAKHGAAS